MIHRCVQEHFVSGLILLLVLSVPCCGSDQRFPTKITHASFIQLLPEIRLTILSKNSIEDFHRFRMTSKESRSSCSGYFFIKLIEELSRLQGKDPEEVVLSFASIEAENYFEMQLNQYKIMAHSYPSIAAHTLVLHAYREELKFHGKRLLVNNKRYDNLTGNEVLFKRRKILMLSRILDHDIYKEAFDQALSGMDYFYLENLIALNVFTDPNYIKMFGQQQTYLNGMSDKVIDEFESHIKKMRVHHPVETCCVFIDNLLALGAKPSPKQKKILKKNAGLIANILKVTIDRHKSLPY